MEVPGTPDIPEQPMPEPDDPVVPQPDPKGPEIPEEEPGTDALQLFSTYATFWIRQAIRRGLGNKARTIRIPVHIGQRERKIARVERELSAELGREPSEEEVAGAAQLPLRQVREVREATRTTTSLDRPVGESGETSFGDLLPSDAPEPEEEVEVSLRGQSLRQALKHLATTRELEGLHEAA
jgi:DNA-directed RNA polymerase sigma subunit (sigma70/sigma32)